MNYDRMRELAGLPAVEPKAVVESVELETVEAVEEVVIAEIEDVELDAAVHGGEAVEVVAEAEVKTPELDAKAETATKKTKVPADVFSAISSRVAELKQSIAQYNDKGYDDGGVKNNAIEALEQIAANLKLEDGLTKASVFYGTLMSPITDLFPPKVVKFLHTAPKAVKEGKQEVDDNSKCRNCDAKIDPKNHDKDSQGLLCVQCAEEIHPDE